MVVKVENENQMINLGSSLGSILSGGEIIELVGDVGSGKTTLTRGIAAGLGVKDYVQSPSFTINRVYRTRDNMQLYHYDFYRLNSAGLMNNELQEVIFDPGIVVIIEWAKVVDNILPKDRLIINIKSIDESVRSLDFISGGNVSNKLMEKLLKS